MAKRKEKKRRPSRFERIERKFDRILTEIIILRQKLTGKSDVEEAIDKMHRMARKMRMQAENERDLTRRMFHTFFRE